MDKFCVFWSPLFSAYWGQMRQILTQYCFVTGCVHLNGVVLCVSSRDCLEVLPSQALNLNLWAESQQHYQMWHQTKAKTSGQLVDLYRWRNSELRAYHTFKCATRPKLKLWHCLVEVCSSEVIASQLVVLYRWHNSEEREGKPVLLHPNVNVEINLGILISLTLRLV